MSAAEVKGAGQTAALEVAERGLALALAAVEGAFDSVSVTLEAVLAAKRGQAAGELAGDEGVRRG